jgi:Tol biopolymer transport system component
MNRATYRASAIPPSFYLLTGLVLGIPLTLCGCGNERPVHAQSVETRVTQGEGLKYYPRYSPDGNTLAYSSKEGGGQRGGWAVYVVPVQGGQPHRVSPDTLSEYVVDWTPDGKGLYVYDDATSQMCRLGLEGAIEERYGVLENGHVEDASPDGTKFLAFRFTGTSYDAGILKASAGATFESLSETPDWELYGSFGPGPDDVTVCQFAAYTSPTSGMVVWSPSSHTFTPITVPRGRHLAPTWSPDGRYLAYSTDASGNRDLWIFEVGTHRAIQVTKTPEDENAPHWAPDEASLAFSRETRTSHLFVADMRARTKRQLTAGPDWDGRPIASLDRKWVAFLRRSSTDATSPPQICVLSLTDTVTRAIDLGGLVPQVERHFVTWSPDDRELAVAAADVNGNVDIYRVAKDGGAPIRVTIDAGVDVEPTWSPDGSQIAYLRMGEGDSEIWVIPAHGGLARRVSQNQDMCEGVVWAPDSDHLAYHVAHGLMRYELWTTSARHPEDARRVLPESDSNWANCWSADGKQILVNRLEGKRYAIDAVSRDGTNRVALGVEAEDKADRPFLNWTPEGAAYFDVLYPGGSYVYADGETRSDIYILRVKELLSGKIAS